MLISVHIEGNKRELAMKFGATQFIVIDISKEVPVPAIQPLTGDIKMDAGTIIGGDAEYVFELKGDPGSIIQAYWSTCIGGELIVF